MKYRGIGEPALPGAFFELRYPCCARGRSESYICSHEHLKQRDFSIAIARMEDGSPFTNVG